MAITRLFKTLRWEKGYDRSCCGCPLRVGDFEGTEKWNQDNPVLITLLDYHVPIPLEMFWYNWVGYTVGLLFRV